MGRLIDETGNRHGRLTVLTRAGSSKEGRARWLCRCDCGNEVEADGRDLRRGGVRSCGCLFLEAQVARASLPEGVGMFRALMRNWKRGAKKRGLVWALTEDQARELTSQPCFYCGGLPSQHWGSYHHRYNGVYMYNGLDRVDNARGYEIDNVVPCCFVCNRAKGGLPQTEFLEWIVQAYKHSLQEEE